MLILKQNLLQMPSAKIIIYLSWQCFMINHCQVLKWKKIYTRNESFILQPSKELSCSAYLSCFIGELQILLPTESRGTSIALPHPHNEATLGVCMEIFKLTCVFKSQKSSVKVTRNLNTEILTFSNSDSRQNTTTSRLFFGIWERS